MPSKKTRKRSRSRKRSPSPSASSSSSRSSNSSVTRRKKRPNEFPRKVPLWYAYEKLQEYGANHRNDMSQIVGVDHLKQIADDPKHTLVPLEKLKKFFRKWEDFKTFKTSHFRNIPREFWEDVIKDNPKKRPYVRKYVPTTRKRHQKYKMKAFIGEPVMSDVSDDDSVISIDPQNDECDETNVNLPKPICQAFRRVCRYYKPNRQYKDYQKDGTENRRYMFRLNYE